MIHTDVTCSRCLDRQRTVNGKTFRERYRVGDPARRSETFPAHGHAVYFVQGLRTPLCQAEQNNPDSE